MGGNGGAARTRPTLVTGASGFVGRRLVERLRAIGENCLTHSTADGELATLAQSAPNVCHVFHLAAKTYVPDSWRYPASFYDANLMGTIHVLELCRARQASLTLVSSYVYGQPQFLPISEDHPLNAFNPYAHSKQLAEEAVRFYAGHFAVRTAIVRPFNLYGPGQRRDFLIPTLIAQALDEQTNPISLADSRPRRDYLFVDDFIDMLLLMREKAEPGLVVNAGSGCSVNVGELAERILTLTACHKEVVYRNEERPDEVLDTVADITRARRTLGWAPSTDLDTGLRRTIDWVRSAAG